jgi:hypothetical protein
MSFTIRMISLATALAAAIASPAAADTYLLGQKYASGAHYPALGVASLQVTGWVDEAGTDGTACVELWRGSGWGPPHPSDSESGCGALTVAIDDVLQRARIHGTVPSTWTKTTYETVTTTTAKGRHKTTTTETVPVRTEGSGSIRVDVELLKSGEAFPYAGPAWCGELIPYICPEWHVTAGWNVPATMSGSADGTLVDATATQAGGSMGIKYLDKQLRDGSGL